MSKNTGTNEQSNIRMNIVGFVILLLIAYILMRRHDIDVVKLFTSERLTEIFSNKTFLAYVLLGVILFASYKIFTTISENFEESEQSESSSQSSSKSSSQSSEQSSEMTSTINSAPEAEINSEATAHSSMTTEEVSPESMTSENLSESSISETSSAESTNASADASTASTTSSSTWVIQKQFMSFDRFYQTFIMTPRKSGQISQFSQFKTEADLSKYSIEEAKKYVDQYSKQEAKQYAEQTAGNNGKDLTTPDDMFMILRTDIDGIKYYLIMDSTIEQNLEYRKINIDQDVKYADKADICKMQGATTKFIAPTLIREDLLATEYTTYLTSARDIIKKAVDTQKAVDIVNQETKQTVSGTSEEQLKSYVESESEYISEIESKIEEQKSSVTISDTTKTELQKYLQKTIYPRYVHHMKVLRLLNTDIPVATNVLTGVNQGSSLKKKVWWADSEGEFKPESEGEYEFKMPTNAQIQAHSKKKPMNKIGYKISSVTRDQLEDVLKSPEKSPYFMDVSKSFAPYTILRKKEVNEIKKQNGKSTAVKKTKEIVNDKKFVCGVQRTGSVVNDQFSTFFVQTITPSIDELESILQNVHSLQDLQNLKASRISATNATSTTSIDSNIDKAILKGTNNTNIVQLDPLVNLYLVLDLKNENLVPVKNVKCWLSRLDGYTDPVIKSMANSSTSLNDPYFDKTSPYYNKPRVYPIGIIPNDYKQCNTLEDGTIDSSCRGKVYVDGVDYSDARRIEFEVVAVKLIPM